MNSHSAKRFFRILAILSLSLAHSAWAYTVTGCFIDINSNGVAGLTIAATGDSTITGADGCFTLTNVSAGTTSLTMSGTGYLSRTLSFAKVSANNKSASIGTKYAIATTNGYKVKIAVVDRETAQPLDDVIFTIDGNPAQAESNDYVLSVSEPGNYTLTATKADYDTVSVNFAVNDNSPVSSIGTIKLWGGSYKVVGRVVDGDKNPVADAEVTLSTGGSTTTAEDGTFTIDGMKTATTFNLTATKAGYTTITRNNYSVNNNVPVRNMNDLLIRAGGYKVVGRMVDIDQNPVAGVNLSLNVGDSSTTAEDGTFEVAGIMAPSSFSLTGTKSGYKEVVRNGSVNESSHTRNLGDIYMIASNNGFRVNGCVTYMGQKIAHAAEVTIGNKSTRTDDDGCYLLTLDNANTYNYKIEVMEDFEVPGEILNLPGNSMSIPAAGFAPKTGAIRITETQPNAIIDGHYIPSLQTTIQPVDNDTRHGVRDGLGLETSTFVDGSNITYIVTIKSESDCPVYVQNFQSSPELPGCMSFVSGQEDREINGEMVSFPTPNSTHPLSNNGGIGEKQEDYLKSMHTPLNCNLKDDPGNEDLPVDTKVPYGRGNGTGWIPQAVKPYYPYSGNPNARILQCEYLGILGGLREGPVMPTKVQVQVVVRAENCTGGGGNPFNLGFNAKGINCDGAVSGSTRKRTRDGKSCQPIASKPAKIVIPPVLPQLNVKLVGETPKVTLGEGDLSYTLLVRNEAEATSPATGIVLDIGMPAAMAATTSIDDTKGSCDRLDSAIKCHLNDIPGDSQVPVTITFKPSEPVISGSVRAELTSGDSAPQTVALNYQVLAPPPPPAPDPCKSAEPPCTCNPRPASCPEILPPPPPPPADVAIIVDDTGSMSEEIGGLRTALSAFINFLNNQIAKPVMQLLSYKDNFSHRITTDNMSSLQTQVNRLTAAGGDDCPENAGGALSWVVNNTATNRLKDGGRILLITDASPHDDTDIDKLISQLRTRGISLDVLLSDNSCMADGAKLDAVAEFSKMAQETGGIFMPFFRINDPDDESAARHYENVAFSVMNSSINPTLIAATPNTMPTGSTVDVKFTAANTNFNESVQVSFTQATDTKRRARDGKEDSIIVNQVTVTSATELLLNITVPDSILPGFYNVVAETQLGEFTERAEGKELLEIAEPSGIPEILSITPLSALQDTEIEVTVYASDTHFNAGAQLSFGDPGIIVKQTRILSNTALTAQVEVSEQAKLGLHPVTVMSGSETASSDDAQFLVMAESTSARIKSLSANRGIRGSLVQFDIVGKHTHFEEGVTELRLLEGLTLMSFEVTSSTEANAVILVDADAPLGFQDVIMVTEEEVAVKLNGFEVSERGPHGVEGYALDKVGEPVAKVYVSLRGQGVFTDATGYFRMTGLTAGEYTLTGNNAGYHFAPETFAVGQPPAEMANVVLKAASAMAVKIRPDDWHPAKQGGQVGYTITVTNEGTETATGIVLTDIVPENTSLAAIEGGNCQVSTASCQLRDLGPNNSAKVKVTINNTQTRTLINTVTVTSNEYPPATVKHWKRVLPYLSVMVETTPDEATPEGQLYYTLDVDLSPYAPTPATDVQLVTRLPHGVALKGIETAYGSCDTSDLPTIICDLVDLSVENPDDVSHVTITINTVLKDPGLLLLTHEAKVSANEHPAHFIRERTDVLIGDGVEVDIVFVLDVTGSMQEEINGIVKAMRDYINELDTTTAPSIALVTFTDEVSVKAFTRDLELLKDTIGDIEASGGGTCEEAAVEALEVVIPHVKPGGQILFATDASAYPDADIQGVIEELRNKAIRFHAVITGDCSQPNSWNELP